MTIQVKGKELVANGTVCPLAEITSVRVLRTTEAHPIVLLVPVLCLLAFVPASTSAVSLGAALLVVAAAVASSRTRHMLRIGTAAATHDAAWAGDEQSFCQLTRDLAAALPPGVTSGMPAPRKAGRFWGQSVKAAVIGCAASGLLLIVWGATNFYRLGHGAGREQVGAKDEVAAGLPGPSAEKPPAPKTAPEGQGAQPPHAAPVKTEKGRKEVKPAPDVAAIVAQLRSGGVEQKLDAVARLKKQIEAGENVKAALPHLFDALKDDSDPKWSPALRASAATALGLLGLLPRKKGEAPKGEEDSLASLKEIVTPFPVTDDDKKYQVVAEKRGGREFRTITDGTVTLRGYLKSADEWVLEGEQTMLIPGIRQITYIARKGNKHGPVTIVNDLGETVKGQCVNNKKAGDWITYETGTKNKTAMTQWKDGVREGLSVKYDSDGAIIEQGICKGGRLHGKWFAGTPEGNAYSERNYKHGVLHGAVLYKSKMIVRPGVAQMLPNSMLIYRFEFVDGKPKYERENGTTTDFYNMMDVIAQAGGFDARCGYVGRFDERQFYSIFGRPEVSRNDGFGNFILAFRCRDGVVVFNKVAISNGLLIVSIP